jgi:copper(I)-binding protein
MKRVCGPTLFLGACVLASCSQSTPAPKTDGVAMPTPTISTQSVEMPAGTQLSTLSIINAKMKTPTDARPTSGYLVIENGGTTPERLLSATSVDFARVELRDTVKNGDMIEMVTLEGVDIPPNSQTIFEPGGKHISLAEAKRPLANGDSVKVTLTFSNSGPIETNFVALNKILR